MPNTGDYVRATDFDELKPQLSIGTVTTGAAGTNASASVTGTTPNFKLNLTIPRGNTGATGPAGPSGTFTGPLKPTAGYFRSAQRSTSKNNYVVVPPGGTWACFTIYDAIIFIGKGGSVNQHAAVVSGNSNLFIANDYSDATVAMNRIICWRIQ